MDRKYEVMFILRPDTSEEDLEKLLKTMESNVAATGGKVTGFDRALGKRRLDVYKRQRSRYPPAATTSCESSVAPRTRGWPRRSVTFWDCRWARHF